MDGGRAWAQRHGLPLYKADLAEATAQCLICQQHKPTLSPKHGTIPGETSRPPAGKLITLTCSHRGGMEGVIRRGRGAFSLE